MKKLSFTLTIIASFAMAITLLVPSGCSKPSGIGSGSTVAITGKTPILEMPARPTLESLDPDELAAYTSLPESAKKKLQGNDKKLKMYAAQLQVAIEDYNTYAAIRNKISDEAVGVKPLGNKQ